MDQAPDTNSTPNEDAQLPGGLPHVVLGYEHTVGTESYEFWRDATLQLFDVGLNSRLDTYQAASECYNVDGVIFAKNLFSSSTYTRSPAKVRMGEGDYITLHLPIVGREPGETAGVPFEFAPDRVTLIDWAHPYRSTSEWTQKFGIMLPRERVEYADWLYDHPGTLDWTLAAAQGRMLAGAWRDLFSAFPDTDPLDAPNAVDGLVAMVNRAIHYTVKGGSDFGRHTERPTRPGETDAAAMRRFIDTHLADPDLGIAMLADAFHCSRATVYRRFGDSAGIRNYIRDQRIQRCYTDLVHPRHPGEPIHTIAERWGFSSLPHFYRVFKEKFGCAPGELTALDPPTRQQHADRTHISRLQEWIAR